MLLLLRVVVKGRVVTLVTAAQDTLAREKHNISLCYVDHRNDDVICNGIRKINGVQVSGEQVWFVGPRVVVVPDGNPQRSIVSK